MLCSVSPSSGLKQSSGPNFLITIQNIPLFQHVLVDGMLQQTNPEAFYLYKRPPVFTQFHTGICQLYIVLLCNTHIQTCCYDSFTFPHFPHILFACSYCYDSFTCFLTCFLLFNYVSLYAFLFLFFMHCLTVYTQPHAQYAYSCTVLHSSAQSCTVMHSHAQSAY